MADLFGGYQDVHDKLAHALIEYDRKELQRHIRNPRAYHNPNFLGIALEALSRVDGLIAEGKPLRQAILSGFTGRLLDRCLVAVGLPKSTDAEQRGSLADYGY